MATIGILFERSTHHARECFRGICAFARQHRYDWRFHFGQLPETPQKSGDLVGLIVASGDESFSQRVHATGLPSVNLSSACYDPYLIQIWLDDVAIGRIAAAHLHQRGFRRWAYFGISKHYGARKRRLGFIQGLAELGYARDTLVVDLPGWENESGKVADATLLAAALKTWQQPIGCFAFEDDRGAQVLRECRKAGIEIPRQVGVIGARNDDYVCETTFPTLSSIDIGQRKRGFKAAAVLADLIDGKPVAKPVPPVSPGGLVVRQSTGPAKTDDPMVNKAVAFIHTHARQPISVTEVVEHVATNRRTLEMRFQSVLNCSPHRHIQHERIEVVKQLLLTTDLDTQGIADAAGFRNRAHMSTLFRKITGQTMMQFRGNSSVT